MADRRLALKFVIHPKTFSALSLAGFVNPGSARYYLGQGQCALSGQRVVVHLVKIRNIGHELLQVLSDKSTWRRLAVNLHLQSRQRSFNANN